MTEQYPNDSNTHKKTSKNANRISTPLEAARAENLSDRFVFVDGRRFIADLPNVIFPHDDLESARKYRQHYIYKCVWQGLLSAPVKETITVGDSKCLDVACGSGIWAMEIAKESPMSIFVGIDIGHDFPDDELKPQNVGFLGGCNLNEGIPFPDDTFNYIHQRHLFLEFPMNTWIKAVLPEMIRVTKPLGWIEVDDVESDPRNMGPNLKEFNKAYIKFAARVGFVNSTASQIVQQFTAAGLINIEFSEKKIPVGSWAGQLGELGWKDMSDGMISLKTVLQTEMGVTEEEYFQKMHKVGKEASEYKTYLISYRVWGQRP